MLGVPRDAVLADYAMSERVVDYEAQYAARPREQKKPSPWEFITRLPVEVRAPLLRSEPEYIRAALTAIETKEGSIDAYFERVLKISEREQRAIRALLLEPDASERTARAE